MTEKFDTSWFDLKNYEAFKKMSVEEWIWQLKLRHFYRMQESHNLKDFYNEVTDEIQLKETIDEDLLSFATTLKAGVIPDNPNCSSIENNLRAEALIKGHSFSTASVNSLTSYEIWKMADNSDLSHVWEACQNTNPFSIEIDRNEEYLKDILTPHDFYIKQYTHFKYLKPSAHVVIDLSAADEQIKNDFNQWLTNYRKTTDNQVPKKPAYKKLLTQADFNYWIQYGVIPYLDLVLIAKIEGKKITQNQLARLIFPNEYDVDIIGRLRQVTKPEAERLIKNEIHRTLSTQLVAKKSGMKNT